MSDMTVYLDNNATTRVDDRVLAAMLPFYSEQYGNPSSMHRLGTSVAARIEEARAQVAHLIGARDSEIVFTSGGTEADNAALRGVLAARPSKRHVIISAVEHHAIIETAEQLEREGVAVSHLGVDAQGRLDLAALPDLIRDDTALISVMLANNETGVIFPVGAVSEIARRHGVPVHTDAVNAIGKMPVNVDELGVGLLSLSGHKFHAPKGIGALYIRGGAPFRPLLLGGSQEHRRRGGTHNTAGIIALGTMCALLSSEDEATPARMRSLRDRFESELRNRFPSAHIIGQDAERLPNTCCVCFPGVEAEAVLMLLSEAGICASGGAACSSGSLEPSHVLHAMNVEPTVAQGEIRFSFGRYNSDGDLDRLLDVLPAILAKVAAVNIG